VSHMVIFQTQEGSPGYHQTGELEDAVAFVENLRNEQSVEQVRIFRMEEVPFEFKGYFRVELMEHSGSGGTGHPLRRMDLLDVPTRGEPATADEDEADDEADESVELGLSAAFATHRDDGLDLANAVGSRRGLFGR
jgi:hypothetical protein